MDGIRETVTVKCVKAVGIATGWTVGITTWSAHALADMTVRAVGAVMRRKGRFSPDGKAVSASSRKKFSFVEKFRPKRFEKISTITDTIDAIDRADTGGRLYENTLLKQATRDVKDAQPSKRYNAVMTLASIGARLGRDAVIQPLSSAMKDTNGNIRSQACKALVDLKAAASVEAVALLLKDSNPGARLEALRGIYKLSDDTPLIVHHLLEATNDQHKEVRKRAATYLGWFKSEGAVSALIDLLDDKEQIVRKTAVLALGELRDKNAIIHLIDLLGDKDDEIREVAIYTLRILTGQNFGYNPKSDLEERKNVMDEWRKWWNSDRASFRIHKKEFIVSGRTTVEDLERLRESERTKREEEQKKAVEELAEKAKEEREKQEARKKADEEIAAGVKEEKKKQEARKKAAEEEAEKKADEERAAKAKEEKKKQEARKKAAEEEAEKKADEDKKPIEKGKADIVKKHSRATEKTQPHAKKATGGEEAKMSADAVREKMQSLNKEERDQLKKKLRAKVGKMREKMKARDAGKKNRQKGAKSHKSKMDDLEQMLLLKKEKKADKKK